MTKTKHSLEIFVIITLASGWLGVLLDTILTEQPEGDSLGMGLWLVLPLLTAIILSTIKKDWKNSGLTPKFKGNLKWYLLSLTAFPVVGAVSLTVAKLFGKVDLSAMEIGVIFPIIASAFILNIIKNVFEEFAWRGFLTPKLMEYKLSDWLLYIVSGLVWALWHVPYYLIFLDESVFEALSISRIGFTVLASIIMLCWNVLYVEMFRLTKTVWTCTVMHAAEDGVIMTLFIGRYYLFTNSLAHWIFDPHIGVVATTFILTSGIILRSIRIKKEQCLSWNE